MEQLKRELLLLKTKLQSLMQIGTECKNLITFSEGFVKRDLSLIRLNFEIKLRKLEEKHINELKTMAKNEKDIIDWEVKCIQDETKRLEQSAEEFQASVDKQRARVFQDEVKCLQKVIEKAAKKFKRKKLKFDINKDVKKFFDELNRIGKMKTEIVDLNMDRSKVENEHSNDYDTNASQQTCRTDIKELDEGLGSQSQCISDNKEKEKEQNLICPFHEKLISNGNNRLNKQKHPNLDDRLKDQVVNKNDNTVNVHRDSKHYANKTAIAKTDPMKANFETKGKVGNNSNVGIKEKTGNDRTTKSSPDKKSNLLLTETDWKKIRDFELTKKKIKSTAKEEVLKSALETPKTNREDGHAHIPARMHVLQELCDRLDSKSNDVSQNIERNSFGKPVGSGDELFTSCTENNSKTDAACIKRLNNTVLNCFHMSQDTANSNPAFQTSDDLNISSTPKGIIKNWANGKNSIKRSKSDSSKYSYLRNKNYLNDTKNDRHVKFADAVDASENIDVQQNTESSDSEPENDLTDYVHDTRSKSEEIAMKSIKQSEQISSQKPETNTCDSPSVSSTYPPQEKALCTQEIKENNVLLKFKNALDDFKHMGLEETIDTCGSLGCNIKLASKDTSKQTEKQREGQTFDGNDLTLASPNPHTNDLDSARNEEPILQKPRLELFDLNSFRATIESLKEEIKATRQKHEVRPTDTFVDKSIIQEADNIPFTDEFDDLIQTIGAEKTDAESVDSNISTGQHDPESTDQHNSDPQVSTNQHYHSELSAITDQQDSESCVSENFVLDFKPQGVLNQSQSNGVKVSHARIAAYVRRRLKAVELPSPTPSVPWSSSITGSGAEYPYSDRSKLSAGLTLVHDDAVTSLKHPNPTMVSNSQGLPQKQHRNNKQRLPSSKEMLFDS